jgi:hypothetical protein
MGRLSDSFRRGRDIGAASRSLGGAGRSVRDCRTHLGVAVCRQRWRIRTGTHRSGRDLRAQSPRARADAGGVRERARGHVRRYREHVGLVDPGAEAPDEGTVGSEDVSASDASTAKHDESPDTVTASAVKGQDGAKRGVRTDTTDQDGRQPTARDNVEQASRSGDDEQRRKGPAEHKGGGGDTDDANKSNSDSDED